MSIDKDKKILDIEKKVISDFYFISGKKKYFWQSTAEIISCRVRDKNHFNNESNIIMNLRAFLLDEDKEFLNELNNTMKRLRLKDKEQLENYIISAEKAQSKLTTAQIKSNLGIYAMNYPEEELKTSVDLKHIISCKIYGYEKEFFNLKCYSLGILPDFVLRSLYHTKFNHSKYEKKKQIKLIEPLELEKMLKKISFS
ncbi:MAG: hypothetical protein JXA99_11470 [Candidatus Lokiarchaeota archaeon]|nr:hypothetical protein [Candidatus Lokiarchaeota archaeon]